jgi:hypothetical protein
MLRLIHSAVALAGMLVTARPSFADPLPVAPSNYVQLVAAAAAEQPAPSAAAWSLSSDATAPAGLGLSAGLPPEEWRAEIRASAAMTTAILVMSAHACAGVR